MGDKVIKVNYGRLPKFHCKKCKKQLNDDTRNKKNTTYLCKGCFNKSGLCTNWVLKSLVCESCGDVFYRYRTNIKYCKNCHYKRHLKRNAIYQMKKRAKMKMEKING